MEIFIDTVNILKNKIMNEKFEQIATTYINGNISVFNKEVKKMNKKTLVEFMQYMSEYFTSEYSFYLFIKALS